MNPALLIGIAAFFVLSAFGRPGRSSAVHVGAEGGTAPTGKTLPPIPPTGQGQSPSSTAVFWEGGVPGDSTYPLPPRAWDTSSQATYITQLYEQEAAHKAAIRGWYNVDRLKQITRAAAAYYGVPPSWVWGILQGESNYFPVGIYKGYTGSPKGAIAARSSAYGMGQVLRGRFTKSEASHLASSTNNHAWMHHDLLDPKFGIWTVAASYGRMARKRGGGHGRPLEDQVVGIMRAGRGIGSPKHQGSLAVGHWWAGQGTSATKGATAKTRQIVRYGMDVWRDKKRPKSSWQKGGAVMEVDFLPPWRTGQLSAFQKTQLLNSALVLEAAGDELHQLNAELA